MILTKVNLDLRAPSARQALVDCGDMHRNIQALFGSSREDAEVLFRTQKTDKGCSVYILSACAPTFDEKAAHNGMIFAGSRDMAAVEALFTAGRTFRFDLLTMPAKKELDRTRKNSQRRILRDPAERVEWLGKKADQGGFRLLSVSDEEGETLHAKKSSGELWLHTTRFTGTLRIEEPEKFLHAWKYGIGAEKAYGLGMLMVR